MQERLQPGAFAPSFDFLNYDGKIVSLSAYRGKKIWLAFYRYSSCPLCLDHFSEVVLAHQELRDAKTEFIAVFESKTIDLTRNPCTRAPVFYPMIADSELKLYQLYGVERSPLGLFHPSVLFKLGKAIAHGFPQKSVTGSIDRLPAHFLIDEDGLLHTTHYGSNIADQIPWWKVKRFLAMKKENSDQWSKFHYR